MNLSNKTVCVTRTILLLMAVVLLSSCMENAAKTSASKQFAPKLGICTSAGNYPKIKSSGFVYVEEAVGRFLVPTYGEDVFNKKLSEANSLGAKLYACNSFLPGKLKSTGPDTKFNEILEYSRTAFRRAEMAGIKVIVFGSGGSRRVPEGFSKERATAQLVVLLKKMGPIAKQYGVTVAMEPLNKRESNILNSVAEGLELVKRVDHPNIRLLADVYHMAMDGEPAENIVKAGKYLHHVHIAEKDDRRSPGINRYDFMPYFAALKKIGYQGRISIECKWTDFETELPIAMEYLNEQIEAVN